MAAYIGVINGKGHLKQLNTKYKTLFVCKYSFICEILYKQLTMIQISELDTAITNSNRE